MGLPGEDEVVEPESVVLGDALFDLVGRFSPGEVDLRVRAATCSAAVGAPPKKISGTGRGGRRVVAPATW